MKKENAHGGSRPGSGRPKGWGKYGEPTKALRVPVSSVTCVEKMLGKLADFHLRLKSGKMEIEESLLQEKAENNLR